MDDRFYKRYRCYENYPIEDLKHIPEVSFYNHNYYIANNPNGYNSNDLIYVETDELSGIKEFYHINGDVIVHIGYAYTSDKYITLEQEVLS